MKRMSLKQRVLYGAIVVALVMVLMIIPVTADHMESAGWGVYQGGDFLGVGWSNTQEECAQRCLNYPQCKYVTWTQPGNEMNRESTGACWLKDNPALPLRANIYSFSYYRVVDAPAPGGEICYGVVPNADFTATPVSGEKPLTVRFTADVASGASEGWTFSDSIGVSNEHNPTHVFTKAGTFTVDHMVAIRDSCGVDHTDRKTKTNYITVTEPLQPASIPVFSVPAGAAVYLNNVYKGPTPVTITIPSTQLGTYTLKITYPGYNDHSESIITKSGGNYPVSVNLVQVQTTGSLSVSSNPSGASVYVDTVYQGTTPVTIPLLAAGSHPVRLTLTGYTDYDTTVNVNAVQKSLINHPFTQSQPSSTTGSLAVTSTPSGASITVDSVAKGTTPNTIPDLSKGSHTVKLTKSGYWDSSQTVTIDAGKTTPLNVNLVVSSQQAPSLTSAIPTPYQPVTGGAIVITSNPPGANVYLDGQSSGTTPFTIPNVNPGTHTILLTMQGYSDASRTVEVTAGSQNQISVDLIGGKKTPGFEAVLVVLSVLGLILLRMYRNGE